MHVVLAEKRFFQREVHWDRETARLIFGGTVEDNGSLKNSVTQYMDGPLTSRIRGYSLFSKRVASRSLRVQGRWCYLSPTG